MPQARIGVSGWRYPRWRGDFYPAGLRQRDELAYLGQQLNSVEINGSFYSLQRPTSYAAWRAAVPEDFVFAVKGGRFITHLKRLQGVDTALANFFASGPLALGPMLGPVLWQLPERVEFDATVLDDFLGRLPRTTQDAARLAQRHDDKVPEGRALTSAETEQPLRHALEPRHTSFDCDAAREVLRAHGVAMVVADTAGRWPQMGDSTTDFHYVRLHGEERLYAGGYTDASLQRWGARLDDWLDLGHDVFVYFDNDADGRAPHDAVRLRALLSRSTVT
ncbi:DUF72 domain-containing protein [Nostocoides sp. HKS02]|uniref:DUF72 domain-containing protein n=1 Tax=Nostocoides sp. HKS02 TaxID=1813880 RepID=UPI0012B44F77|nr:DUF72 domain-containing protein [Tetrasphaera sp. HKS02]QGN59380.1 DUF72 domain-containing protein [Tetrasphaera sp. HKS02]